MDQDSLHPVRHPRCHHAAPHPESHPFLSVSRETAGWSSDMAGALAARLHLRALPAGAPAAAPHHAAVVHLQLRGQKRHQQEEEEEVICS